MPDYVYNRLKIEGTVEQVREVLEYVKCDDKGVGTVDFNKITPMPKWVFRGEVLEIPEGFHPAIPPGGLRGVSPSDEEKWGEENTYLGWARKNWGVKWNASGYHGKHSSGNTVYFRTADSGVPELIEKIAWMFPAIVIEYMFSKGNGEECWVYRFKENMLLEETHYETGTKEALELGFEIEHGGDSPQTYR